MTRTRPALFASLVLASAVAVAQFPPVKEVKDTRAGRAELSKLGDLQKAKLGTDDVEVRVWEVLDGAHVGGIVLKRAAKRWSATWLPPILPPYAPEPTTSIVLPLPGKKGDAIWSALQKKGLLTITGEEAKLEGVAYDVEVRQGAKYRRFAFGNLDAMEPTPSAKKVAALVGVLENDLNLFAVREAYLRKRLPNPVVRPRGE